MLLCTVFSLIATKAKSFQGDKITTFRIAIENFELMHECYPQHFRMGAARMKIGKEMEEKGMQNRLNLARSKWAQKKIP